MTADLATLRALKKRCEKATKPDRELDADLFQNFGGDLWMEARKRAAEPCGAPEDLIVQGARWRSPFFTASIDAALALVERVLPGWSIGCRRSGLSEHADAELWNPNEQPGHYSTVGQAKASNNVRSIPLAICAALLSALISRAEEARS